MGQEWMENIAIMAITPMGQVKIPVQFMIALGDRPIIFMPILKVEE